MRIALLVSGIMERNYESLTITTLRLAKKLAEKGHDVVVITRKKFDAPTVEKKDDVTFYRIESFGRFALYNKLLSFPLAVHTMQKHGTFDVIHGFSASPILVLRSILAKILFSRKAKIVHTLKSYPIKQNITAKGGSFMLSRLGDTGYKLLNFADYVTVQTQTHARKLCERDVKENKVKIVNSFIDLERFFPRDKKKLKAKYGYLNKKVILHYGSMWEIKGTDYLLKGMPLVLRTFPNARLLLIPRNTEQALKNYMPLIKELQIEKSVEFILHEVKIEDYVGLADAVVLPYPHLEGTEGNPSCLLEALASGTPVVSTKLPELVEVFSDCALLVEPKDIRALAESIISALSMAHSRFVDAGITKAKEFGVEKVTKQFLELYRHAG